VAFLSGALCKRLIRSVELREENRLRAFGKRVPRRTYGPKRKEVTGNRRKLRSGKLNIRMSESKRVGWAGLIAWSDGSILENMVG
jgi:hypothetical protein